MILSIRHRILIPFLFINLFLTFVALFVSIEFINSHFENKLYTSAIQKEAKLEYLFDQIITESYLSKKLNKPYISSNSLYNSDSFTSNLELNLNDAQLMITNSKSNESYKLNSNVFASFPAFDGISVFYQTNTELVPLSDLESNAKSTPASELAKVNSDASKPFGSINFQDSNQSSFLLAHSNFENIYFNILIPNSEVFKLKNITMFVAIASIIFVNLITIFIFLMIINRLSLSLSQITDAAKKISKGQITSPLKVMSNDEIGLLSQSFNDMLNNVQTKTAELIYERNRSKMIVAQLPDGIIVTDLEDKLVMANRAAELMLGFSTDRAKGQEIIKYLQDENLQAIFKTQFKYIKDSTITREVNIKQNNKVECYQVIVSPLLDTSYQKNGIITVIRNVTDERKMQSLKDSYLRTVTHELKTPLTSIIGFLDIVLKETYGTLNVKQKDFLSISILNSKYLKKLINDLLELSAIQSGQSKMSYESFQIQPLIENLLKTYHPIVKNRKNVITVNYQENNIDLFADKEKVQKIIENLIVNANKYTENGTIEFFINQTTSFTSFIFKDSGLGMSPDQKARLITALDKNLATDFSFDGITLELSLVKELTKLHNGEIFLESEESNGSVFTVMLPHGNPSNLSSSKEKELVSTS